MPRHAPKAYPCVLCEKRTRPSNRKRVNKSIRKFLSKTFLLDSSIGDPICNTCTHLYYAKEAKTRPHKKRNPSTLIQEPTEQKNTPLSPPSISLPISTTPKTHAYCCICKKPGPKLIVVPSEARFQLFIDKAILISVGSRCCFSHLQDGRFTPESILNLPTLDSILVNRATILELVHRLRDFARKNAANKIEFDSISQMSESDCKNLTGINKFNFLEVCNTVKALVRNTPARTTQTSVGIFLLKLKSGMSNSLLSTIFGISRSSVRRAVSTVRKALMTTFVPYNLGFQHITREQVIEERTTCLAETLLGDGTKTQAILVLDGTYIYIHKSDNFHFQRRTYSMHKGRPLVKPMVIVTTSGYFVSVLGPYLADSKNNDASILNHIIKSNVEDIRSWVDENDVFVVDRGFRDSIKLLEDLGIVAKMPSFIEKGNNQMPTEDANASRLVTKVRWVVESANSRIKSFRYLNHILPTNQVPFIGDFVKIVCALSNKYLPPLNKGNDEADIALGAKMLLLSKNVNTLRSFVEDNNLNRKSVNWKSVEDSILNFPVLDEEQLRAITCGVYQLKLSSSYIQEHLEGECEIQLHQEDHGLLRIRMRSRHVSSKSYFLWIRYNSVEVEAWYCKCRAGARVVGTCSHVAAVLWYLGYAKENLNTSFGVKNWTRYLDDAGQLPDPIDEDDTDTEDDNESVIEE